MLLLIINCRSASHHLRNRSVSHRGAFIPTNVLCPASEQGWSQGLTQERKQLQRNKSHISHPGGYQLIKDQAAFVPWVLGCLQEPLFCGGRRWIGGSGSPQVRAWRCGSLILCVSEDLPLPARALELAEARKRVRLISICF